MSHYIEVAPSQQPQGQQAAFNAPQTKPLYESQQPVPQPLSINNPSSGGSVQYPVTNYGQAAPPSNTMDVPLSYSSSAAGQGCCTCSVHNGDMRLHDDTSTVVLDAKDGPCTCCVNKAHQVSTLSAVIDGETSITKHPIFLYMAFFIIVAVIVACIIVDGIFDYSDQDAGNGQQDGGNSNESTLIGIICGVGAVVTLWCFWQYYMTEVIDIRFYGADSHWTQCFTARKRQSVIGFTFRSIGSPGYVAAKEFVDKVLQKAHAKRSEL